MPWKTTKRVSREILGGLKDGLKPKRVPLRQRVGNIASKTKEHAVSGALAVGGATVGGLVGADIALAKAKARGREAGEQAKAKANEAKDKVSETWKQAAKRMRS
jgi:hypothetical protein